MSDTAKKEQKQEKPTEDEVLSNILFTLKSNIYGILQTV
jgi:hypothetical protein